MYVFPFSIYTTAAFAPSTSTAFDPRFKVGAASECSRPLLTNWDGSKECSGGMRLLRTRPVV